MQGPETVLILNVNDAPASRYLVSRILRGQGWTVVDAATGGEALEVARTARPQIAILDIKLPDISGLEVCRRLKADPATGSIGVIQTSATFVTGEGKARGLDSGADAYLSQPFEAVELVAMVKSLLRLRRSEKEARDRALELTEAGRRKDEFLAMLAHELRNPLSAISAATSLLDDGDLEPRNVRTIAAVIGRQTRQLTRLVDDLMDVSRITRGEIQLRMAPFDLVELVHAVVEAEGAALRDRRHYLDLDLPKGPVYVRGDEARIQQVLQNLLSNARKYTAPGGRIALSVETRGAGDGSRAIVTVTDTGRGLAQEQTEAIFDLFYQVDPTLARTQGGLGIGLTVARRLVEMQGGTLVASSEGLGKGARFTLDLPALAARDERPAHRRDGLGVPARPLRLLLIDDNVDSCDLHQMALERAGHKVDVAYDGIDGYEMLVRGEYDAALVDIGLPGINGFEVARRCCDALGDRKPLLLAVTGYGQPDDRVRSQEAGFDIHLVKPVDLSVVNGILRDRFGETRITASVAATGDGAVESRESA